MNTYEKEIFGELKETPSLTNNNLQIIACAGAGKTEFVSSRIAFLIAEGITKSENVVAFTFTERAAQELKFRIRSKIRKLVGHQPDVGDLFIGTIHSFAYELLKEYVPKYRVYDVLDEGKRFAFLNTISKEIGYDDLFEWLSDTAAKPYKTTNNSWVLNTFAKSVDIIREELLDPEKVSGCPIFHEAYQKYIEILDARRFLDYSGMIYNCVEILSNNSAIIKEVNTKYNYLTVDEYQDINKIQEKLIKLLWNKKNNLCVVGDDDQAIYQWRGSSVKNIIEFTKRYPGVHTHNLPINFRSTDGIITTANKLIRNNSPRLIKSMKDSGIKYEKGDLYKLNFPYQSDEIIFIVNRIKELIGTEWTEKNGKKRGLAYSDIAIFFRSVKYDSPRYIDALREADIPIAVSGIGGLFDTPEIDLVYDIFSFLGDFGKIRQDDGFYIPALDSIYLSAKDIFKLKTPDEFSKNFSELKEEYQNKRRISLQELYADILLLLGISNKEYHTEANEVLLYNLGRFSQAISDYEGTRQYCIYKDIERFCWFIKNYAEGTYDAGEGEDPTLKINAVQIMTLHGTKGLGFPVVFMPYCIDRKPRSTDPGFLDPKTFDFSRYNGSEQDERRLFYVGVTRAKKFLYVTTSHDPGYRKKKKYPSRFFNELDEKYFTTDTIIDPVKRKKIKSQPSFEEIQFPTNYSELSDYIHCEYEYKMRYIYGFNPILVQALGYGNQVHSVLNQLHKIAQAKGEVPTPEEAAEILKGNFFLRFAAKDQTETLLKSAMKSVLKYLSLWKEDFILSLKSERNFEMDVDKALISGTIDLLKRENVKDEVLEIIDFKTGNNRKLEEELHLQVQLYTIAAREALNLNVKKAYVHFLDEAKQSRVEILTTPKQLDVAIATIKDSIEGILSRRYRRNPKNVKYCKECDWKKICPKKN
jgi:DNA helicase-2/ATP-dependent DNA helicase PcrA